MCHVRTSPSPRSCATAYASDDFPVPGSPVISSGRRRYSAALTTSATPGGAWNVSARAVPNRVNCRHGGAAGDVLNRSRTVLDQANAKFRDDEDRHAIVLAHEADALADLATATAEMRTLESERSKIAVN